MAAKHLTVELCSPTQPPIELKADKIVLPGSDGIMTVMPGHTLFLTTLASGAIIAYRGKEKSFFAVHGGFAEILNDKVVILADLFEEGTKIDLARAKSAKERAEARIHKPEPDMSVPRAESAMARSVARIQAHSKENY